MMMNTTHKLQTRLTELWQIIPRTHYPLYALLAVWVLSMIFTPIWLWTFGAAVLPLSMLVSVSLLAFLSVTILTLAWGLPRALGAAGIVAVLGWLIEAVGSKTGFPFGSYSYTALLQPQLDGVPLVIPLAWLMMMPPAWAVAQLITERLPKPWAHPSFVLVSALAFTAWDLYLDPQMVAWNFWVWHIPGEYFGIPIVNFFGWILASLLMTTFARLAPLPRMVMPPLLAIYGVTIFLQTIGLALFWAMPAQAACGFVAMSLCLMLALRNWQKAQPA
jgi:lycopene beta-cyclase